MPDNETESKQWEDEYLTDDEVSISSEIKHAISGNPNTLVRLCRCSKPKP